MRGGLGGGTREVFVGGGGGGGGASLVQRQNQIGPVNRLVLAGQETLVPEPVWSGWREMIVNVLVRGS